MQSENYNQRSQQQQQKYKKEIIRMPCGLCPYVHNDGFHCLRNSKKPCTVYYFVDETGGHVFELDAE